MYMADMTFTADDLNRAVDLALIDMKRKYIQKILDLYQKIHPDSDYCNVIYTIRFFDGSKDMIKTITKDVWEFYDPLDEAPCFHVCDSCKSLVMKDSSSESDYSSTSSTLEKFN